VIWRIDISADDPEPDEPMEGWTVRPFHDLFWDRAPGDGERTYLPPVLATDELERPVVIVGSGEPNTVKEHIENRVVSLTEVIDPAVGIPTEPKHFKAAFNWEVRVKDEETLTTYDDFLTSVVVDGLVPSEYITGPMGLFEDQLFFGTFISVVDGASACDAGRGRVFAVDYLMHDAADTNDSSPQTYGPKRINAGDGSASANQLINALADSAPQNVMVMGLTVAQAPSCTVIDTIPDVYDDVPSVDSLSPPAIYLMSQADSTASNQSIVQKRGGSKFGSVKLDVKKKKRVSRVVSWATSMD
jgi:hypothetical protein